MAAIEYFFNVNGYQPQTASLNIQSYERLRQEVANRFPLFDFKVSYFDEENDLISITNDKEFLEAQQQSANGLLVLTIEEVERYDIPEPPVVYASSVFEYDDNTSDSEDEDENPVLPLIEKACKYFDFDNVEDAKESGREVLDNIAHELERAVNSEVVDDALDKASSVIELGLGIGKGFLEGLKKEYTKAKEAKEQPKPSVAQPAVHYAFCDNCNQRIVGTRYKCLSCNDYDLCSDCQAQNSTGRVHTKEHLFALLTNPNDVARLPVRAPEPAQVPEPVVVRVPEPAVPSYAHLKVFTDMGFAQSDLPRIDALMKQYNNDVPSVLERLL